MDTQAQRIDKQLALIHALVQSWEQDAGPVQIFETHISWVVVAGALACKFKKAVRFDFLDFSTLEARRFYCLEELRLNRRLAPALYVDVVAVCGDPSRPVIRAIRAIASAAGNGAAKDVAQQPVLEYAVKMRAFDQDALWSRRIKMQRITGAEADDLAQHIAAFHQDAERASSVAPWGTATGIFTIADSNFNELEELVQSGPEQQAVLTLRQWEQAHRAELGLLFAKRRSTGYVRECHGDMHCANILTINDRAQAFDCLEFNEAMRWIDVMNDIAFPVMDMQVLGRPDLAARFLDQYLQRTGDFGGLAVLRYYLIHRALVRYKVLMLGERRSARGSDAEHGKYLAFALSCLQPAKPMILIMHGYSGSGKSTLAARLLETTGAIRLRSDAERKRPHRLPLVAGSATSVAADMYEPASIQHTYQRLALLAQEVIQSGYSVIVDAAFLRRDQRGLFKELARTLRVPFLIVDVQASEATMRARLVARALAGHDPSDADGNVLNIQLAQHEPMSEQELQQSLSQNLDANISDDMVTTLTARIQMRCEF